MLVTCLAPIATICGASILLNTLLLVLLFVEKKQRSFKIILISISCSNIALALVLVARTVIPIYLKDNASTSFAALIFGVYCNMINVLLLTLERSVTVFHPEAEQCCFGRTWILIVVIMSWVICIPAAVALGVFDLYDGIGTLTQKYVIPGSFASASIICIVVHLVMICYLNYKLKHDSNARTSRSLGRGLILTSRRGLELRQEYRSIGLSFGLVVTYVVFTYPYMLYSFLDLESVRHCEGTQHNMYNILVSLLGFKTAADPIICICVNLCIPRFSKQFLQGKTESTT